MLRTPSGREAPLDLLVMENIFYAGSLSPIYDLKGSERARLARDDPTDPTRVLLDQNLLQHNLGSPILVGAWTLCPACVAACLFRLHQDCLTRHSLH